MHAEELWTADTFKARALRTLLTPASWLYAAGWQSYLSMYRLGLKKAKSPHSPVVCIGNLLVGGTGKTPVTMHVSDVLSELGVPVVISCSGYGSPASEAASLAPMGPLKASEWGDEAALFRWLRPDIPLIVGRRRVLAAELAHRHHSGAVMLMDDGFQHLPLRKHVTILLDPPQANRRCLPAGPYREPRGNRGRADLVIEVFGSSAGTPMVHPSTADSSHAPRGGAGHGDPFRVAAQPMQLRSPSGELRSLTGEIDVLCALGRPAGFLQSLRSQGLTVRHAETRPDHDPLTDGNLLNGFAGGLPIAVTGKDWVKLRERPDVENYDIVIASHEITVEPRDEFRTWLQKKLNGISKKEG